jgi:phthiocerol/phenolphthiocerol synthesis type-I polyketide synthase E
MTDAQEDAPLEGIAIVGLAGRFPQAPTIATFWHNLCAGVESIRTFTDDELCAAGVPEHIWRDPRYVRTAPVLDDIKSFDAAFFGLAPSDAKLMDPQHRLLLECAWEALEDAGIDPEIQAGRIGVYAGSNYSTYLLNNLLTHPEFALQMAAGDSFQLELASDKDNAATRIAHTLNLKGPRTLRQYRLFYVARGATSGVPKSFCTRMRCGSGWRCQCPRASEPRISVSRWAHFLARWPLSLI